MSQAPPPPPPPPPQPPTDEPLMELKSRIEGRNADVRIYRDRIEWDQRKWAKQASEMIPVKSISSVTLERDGFRRRLKVICTGNTIELRCGKEEAQRAKQLITDLLLDRDPAG